MAEQKRADARSMPEAVDDRISRAEALLVEGLDAYFHNRYDDAIHLWTRVLFLDRSHARARAYIDRARTAIAERQRRMEELLHAGEDLLDQGDMAAARERLAAAVTTSGGREDERSAALRVRLERHERAHAIPGPVGRAAGGAPVSLRTWSPAGQRPTNRLVLAIVLVGGVAVVAGMGVPIVRDWLAADPAQGTLAAAGTPKPLLVLSSGEIALVRARNLKTRGRLAEALQSLDRVGSDSAVRAEADALRIDIQRLLLAGASHTAPASRGQVPR